MSKQLVLIKIDHIEKELSQLREMVKSMVENEVTVTLFEPQGLSEFYERALLIYGVSKEQILGKSRKTKIILIRQLLCYFLHDIRDYTFHGIVEITGYTDHSSVIHSSQKVKTYLETKDAKFMMYWNNFKDLMK